MAQTTGTCPPLHDNTIRRKPSKGGKKRYDACGRYVEQRDVRDRECGHLDIKELCKACARRVDDAVQTELRRIKAGTKC